MHTNAPLAATSSIDDQPHYDVIRRNGQLTTFNADKIQIAITKAFLAVEGSHASDSHRIRDIAQQLAQQVSDNLFRRLPDGSTVHIEDIQDQVELALMRNGDHKVARAYVLYREEHARKRKDQTTVADADQQPIHITLNDGSRQPLSDAHLENIIDEACHGLSDVSATQIFNDAKRNLFDGIAEQDVATALIMAARALIENEPAYSSVAARLLLDSLRQQTQGYFTPSLRTHIDQQTMSESYADYFTDYIKGAAELELLDSELTRYDLQRLGAALQPERDLQFTYLGLQTLFDRYFIHHQQCRLEMPQAFFMRVAMGLAINEIDREGRAIEFYQLLSSFDFMSSTPTLFNSGTLRPQLSSCYLTTVPDELSGIYDSIKDNALLSKFAGGLGNDWTPVRGMGSHIKGTNISCFNAPPADCKRYPSRAETA